MRIEVLMAVTMKITVFWYVTSKMFVPIYQTTWYHIPGNAMFKLSEDYIWGILTIMQFKLSRLSSS
jgi:hypothetical protein